MLFEAIFYTLIFSLCFADLDETLLYCKILPPKLTNGLIKRDRVSYYKGQGYLGNMEYMCLPSFDLIGNKLITCQDGIWTTMPQCIPKKRCSPIKTYPSNTLIESDNLTYFQNDHQQILVGSTVTLRCTDNYEYDPNSVGSLLLQCQPDGSWSPMPSCRYMEAMCDYSKLYLPARSRITRMNFKFSDQNRQLHLVGSNLEYNCEDGYRLHDGKSSLIVECLNTGQWSPLPVCEFVYETEKNVRCDYPIHFKNSYITVYNVTIWEDRTYTGQIVYDCNYGYETIDGNDQILSECINGTWTNVNDCHEILTCPKKDLLEIEEQAQNSYVYNVSLQYVRDPSEFVYYSYVLRLCLPNFEHDPSSPPLKIQCQQETRTWTGIPICRAIQTITTTTKQMMTTEHENLWIESDNLVLLEENFTRINQFPTTDIIQPMFCHSNEIPSISNSLLIQSHLNITYAIGTILYYTCQEGYESWLNQTSYTICLMNGTWSIDTFNITMCQLKSETTQEMLLDTSTSSSNTTDESNITINPDEYLLNINDSNETLISSNRSNSTGNRQIRHITSYCKHLPEIDHAQLLIDETTKYNLTNETMYTGSLVFICQYGFINNHNNEQNGPFQLTCQDGIFLPKVICIEKPRCSLPPPIDSSKTSVIDSLINVFDTSTNEAIPGSFILLNCHDKTNFNMTCLENGQWLLPPSSCMGPYKRRCQSGITIPNARTQVFAKLTADGYYDDGSRVTYRCLDNFVHDRQSGPLYIQCRNGRWGPRPRCIPNGCLDPMTDTIENGWKSAESYFMYGDTKYYQLTRYSCHSNAILVETSTRVIDILCQNNQWQYQSLPVCQLQE